MEGIFGVIDGRFKVSLVDSTMMWIVHRAMDKAHGRVKSREGVIERLHEISKFYELSVMQLDGCIKFVQEETDSYNPESGHEEVLAGLAEIRNRLQRRLYESELAILQKDRELADRFESESKLRQALEITERELVSSQEDLELARSRSAGSSNPSHQEGEDENRDEEFCELKDSVDRQVGKIREKLEFDDYEPEVNKRNHCISDVKVEEMGSDIDILKETLDIAFGKMQSAIFFSEMGPIEQQIKSSIENDVVSIFLKGFVRDSQDDLEAEARWKEKQISVTLDEHWSDLMDLMNEVTGLCEDLKPLISQNEMQPQNGEDKNSQEDSDSTSAEYGINNNQRELEHKGSQDVAKTIKNHYWIIRKRSAEAEGLVQLRREMLQKKTSLASRRGESSVSLNSRFQEVLEKVENLMVLNAKVDKILGQNGDVNEEDIPLEKMEKEFIENSRQTSDVGTLADVWCKIHRLQDEENIGMQIHKLQDEENIGMQIHKLQDEENIGMQNQVCMLRQEKEDKEFQNMMMEEIYITLFKGLIENFCNDLSCWELEILISDSICRDFIKNTFNQLDETMESYKIEAQIKDDIYHVVFKEAMKDYCSIYDFGLARPQDVKNETLYLEGRTFDDDQSQCLECKIREEIYGIPFAEMLKEWQKSIGEHTIESLLREEISWFVFGETIESITHKANHCLQTKFFNDYLSDFQITIQEDVCLVFFKEMIREWEEKIEACNLETLIREEICYTILIEAEREVYNRSKRVDVPIQDSDVTEKPPSREMVREWEEKIEACNLETLIREEICYTILIEAEREVCNRSKRVDVPIQDSDVTEKPPSREMVREWEEKIEACNLETLIREEICYTILIEAEREICNRCKRVDVLIQDSDVTEKPPSREMVREWEEKIEACNLETLIREEICYTILIEAEREVCNKCKRVDVPIQDSDVTEKPPSRERLGEGTNTGLESLIQKLNLLSGGIEVVENLVHSASFEMMDNNSNLKPLALECGFDESKATSAESKDIQCILNSLSNKLEQTMKQFNNMLIVGELKPSLETIVSEPEKVCLIPPVDENVPDRKLSLSEHHNMQLNKSDSKCLKLLELPYIFYDFELMANKKLEAIMVRLEEMKHTMDPLPKVMASLQENESLYKKAFIRRCQNLKKAENEVDLLGDQVDILLSLIEKIYLILNQHSPVLQQYLDVSEILRLIKKEVAVIVYTPPEKLNSGADI